MEPQSYKPIIKNVLVCAGTYCIATWAYIPLEFGFAKLTEGIWYHGNFSVYVLEPLFTKAPLALVAACAGAFVIRFVNSERPIRWAFVLALIYALNGFAWQHWSRPPEFLDRVEQTIGALFPALSCILGAILSHRKQKSSS
jgi:hypothetical protein